MISYAQAKEIVIEELAGLERESGTRLVLLEEQTRTESFGWVFFYNSAEFVRSGDVRHALAGNAPLIVDRADGRIESAGSAVSVDDYIVEYEKRVKGSG